jgi:hypothetical protein
MDPNAFHTKYPIEVTTSPIDPYVSATVSASAVVATNRSTCSIPSIGIARVATFVVLVFIVVVVTLAFGIDRRVIFINIVGLVVVVVADAFTAVVFVVADARCITGVVIIARVVIILPLSVVAH